jgi:hypothetical protein
MENAKRKMASALYNSQSLTDLPGLRKPNNQEPPQTHQEIPLMAARLFPTLGKDLGPASLARSASVGARVVLLFAILFGTVAGTRGDTLRGGREDPNKATTSRAAREEAIQSIPMAKLSAAAKAKAAGVVSNSSIFRRLPIRVIPCDPDMYLFLVQHPDVIVSIWETLGAEHLTMQQTGPDSYRVTDDIGTGGTLEFLYRSHDTNVVYVDGTYRGPLFGQPIRARGLMVLRSGYVCATDGRSFVTSRLDAFMHIEPSGVEFLTKTFLPTIGKVADNNFTQTAAFVASVSRTAETNNRGMKRLASKLARVQPDVRRQFAEVVDQVTQKAAAPDTASAKKGAGGTGILPVRPGSTGETPVAPDGGPLATGPRVAQRPGRADPIPAADLKPTPLLQSPSGDSKPAP